LPVADVVLPERTVADGVPDGSRVPGGEVPLDTTGAGEPGGRVDDPAPVVPDGESAAGWLVGGVGAVDPSTGERDGSAVPVPVAVASVGLGLGLGLTTVTTVGAGRASDIGRTKA
jgi:hypothetical protein